MKLKKNDIRYYFLMGKKNLLVITLTGIIYNIGMAAGPWFEGQLVQRLWDILSGTKKAASMISLALIYVAVILLVQSMRYLKRLYVRKFGNDIDRDLKASVYHTLLGKSRAELTNEGAGAVMTKALSDAEACAGGFRKFTTEIFDTGVVMISYLAMLLWYDWRLTILSMIFPPLAYLCAERLKKLVTVNTAKSRESASALNAASLERVQNAVTYRVYGQEENRNALYEETLTDYEKKTVRANIWETVPQPVYQIISMASAVLILWFGGRNVVGQGWTTWNIAAFSTFLACFTKLATKSSKAAKLFNTVQKALVSWKRIVPYLSEDDTAEEQTKENSDKTLRVEHVSFAYPGGEPVLQNVSFEAYPGQIIGITGAVACGKSTLGKLFLNEYPAEGTIKNPLPVNYLGHDPELLSGTIAENIRLGEDTDIQKVLKLVRFDEEVSSFPDREKTNVGDGGVRLSGGQQARLALARTLYHSSHPQLLILDDPFSAVDHRTEEEIFAELRSVCKDDIVLLISHRLTLFPQLDGVLWMDGGRVTASCHSELMNNCPEYRELYETQTAGKEHAE